ncbi:hypothetical protein [Catellatospora sp. NPDC049609]|uniref:hypothetical protein n=1 Tax=Catellatospora sp. NPDC049609 TaxID=3155505 RepID=UPI003439DB21
MTTDASSSEPRRTRNRLQALLYDHASGRELAVDDRQFTVAAGSGWQQATFRLQLFTAADLRPVAVITQVWPREGAGPINHAKRYTTALWRQAVPDQLQPPIVVGRAIIQHDEGEPRELNWTAIVFKAVDPVRFELATGEPTWIPLTDAQLEYLVGRPVDRSRGAALASRTDAPPARPLAHHPCLARAARARSTSLSFNLCAEALG